MLLFNIVTVKTVGFQTFTCWTVFATPFGKKKKKERKKISSNQSHNPVCRGAGPPGTSSDPVWA